MRIVFVVDPLASLRPDHDTSVALMEAAQRAGAEVWAAGAADLFAGNRAAGVWARRVRIAPAERRDGRWVTASPWWRAGEPRRLILGEGDTVLMRLDPPVNDAYLRATFLLDEVARAGARVVNSPRGLREGNEKLLALLEPGLAPDAVVTARAGDVRDALERWGTAVAKPLDGAGGRGVVLLQRDDDGLSALIDLVTDQGTRQSMFQEYLPAAASGDKRILLLDGDPIGAVNRRPSGGDFRGNLALGAVAEPAELDEADREICRRLAPHLRALGLVFVGIDVIGGRLTEVNVTSPTGIREIELLSDDVPSDRVVEWLVRAGEGGHA